MQEVFCNNALRIADVAGRDSQAALQLVLRHYTAEERQSQINTALRGGATTLSTSTAPSSLAKQTLLGAWRANVLVGAVHYHIQPGKTAWFLLPRLAVGEPISTASLLMETAYRRLVQRGVRLVQVVLDGDGDDAIDEATTHENTELLRLGGLVRLTDVCYLVSPADVVPASHNKRWATAASERLGVHSVEEARNDDCAKGKSESLLGGVRFEPYHDRDGSRLQSVMESTYAGADECIGLETAQDAKDLFNSHRMQHAFNPDHWLIVRHQRRDIGCLLLVDHPSVDLIELLYLGLIPEARGHGLGRALLVHAQRITQRLGRSLLVAAVDACNGPAMETYTACGFRTWRRRRLFVRTLLPGNAPSAVSAEEPPSVSTGFPPLPMDFERKD